MITNTLQDPHEIKTNNEVTKAQLKKRLTAEEIPGPGSYLSQNGSGSNKISAIDGSEITEALKRGRDKSMLRNLGLNDSLVGKKGLAFNSTAPRFKDESQASLHMRNRTLNSDDLTKPVYELQMLEGPQIKAKNQLLSTNEMPDMRTIAGKNNTMGLGVFRSDKVEAAFGTKVEPSYL